MAALTACTASESSETPESLLNVVLPMPTITALSFTLAITVQDSLGNVS